MWFRVIIHPVACQAQIINILNRCPSVSGQTHSMGLDNIFQIFFLLWKHLPNIPSNSHMWWYLKLWFTTRKKFLKSFFLLKRKFSFLSQLDHRPLFWWYPHHLPLLSWLPRIVFSVFLNRCEAYQGIFCTHFSRGTSAIVPWVAATCAFTPLTCCHKWKFFWVQYLKVIPYRELLLIRFFLFPGYSGCFLNIWGWIFGLVLSFLGFGSTWTSM